MYRIAFPLMLLAAVLGALVIELVPAQALIAQGTLGGILVALVGTILPVLMAFGTRAMASKSVEAVPSTE